MSTQHACPLPDLETWPDPDLDWKCPECGQDWFVDFRRCGECLRAHDPVWSEYGEGDGTFPLVAAPRGGIQFRYPGPG